MQNKFPSEDRQEARGKRQEAKALSKRVINFAQVLISAFTINNSGQIAMADSDDKAVVISLP